VGAREEEVVQVDKVEGMVVEEDSREKEEPTAARRSGSELWA
jgi:hypothetical protein